MNETNKAKEPGETRPEPSETRSPDQPGSSKPRYKRVSTWLGGVLSAVIAGLIIPIVLHFVGLGSSGEALRKPPPSSSPSGITTRPTGGNSTHQIISFGALKAGDCIAGKNLRLADSKYAWPLKILVVPCTEAHAGEVIFARSYWPKAEAFPGANTINNQALDKCKSVFHVYVGTIWDYSKFDFTLSNPTTASEWRSDRRLLCAAYDPNGPLNSTVRGSRQ